MTLSATDGTSRIPFERVERAGSRQPADRSVAVEAPVAIELDGIAYAVLMASPLQLADLVTGFLLSERLIEQASDILDIDEHPASGGILLRVTLAPRARGAARLRVRRRTADSSCGLCGVESLEQALQPLPRVTQRTAADDPAVFRAYEAIGAHQHLNGRTSAVHAAALCSASGEIRLIREDVGRHNAFDKLIGAMLHAGLAWDGGFALLSSRCSYELVEKAVLSGCPLLATISAPTSLAIERASAACLALRVLVRRDAMLVPSR